MQDYDLDIEVGKRGAVSTSMTHTFSYLRLFIMRDCFMS